MFAGALAFVSLGFLEVALRLAVVEHGHVERLLGKPWYYLVPLGVPQQVSDSVERREGAYRVYDPDLGWSHGPLGQSPPLYFADQDGFRCSEATHEAAQAGAALEDKAAVKSADRSVPKPRMADIVAIGDSFTHGDEVAYEDSWPAILARRTGREVLNLGVGGYGVDQAILRYELTAAEAPLVLLGLIAGDLERALTQVYLLTGGGLKTKPMFNFEGGLSGEFEDDEPTWFNRPAIFGTALVRQYELGVESPFFQREPSYDRRLWASTPLDFLYLWRLPRSLLINADFRHAPIFSTPGRRHEMALEIIEYGAELVRSRGARFVVVLLGNNNTYRLRSSLEDPWALLRRSFDQRGIEYVSTTDQLYQQYLDRPESVINATGVHYTPEANARVASILMGKLPITASARNEMAGDETADGETARGGLGL